MTTVVQDFESLCRDAVEQFIQTAIVVDNEAGFNQTSEPPLVPVTATKKFKPTISKASDQNKPLQNPKVLQQDNSRQEIDDSHYLNAKVLGDAFLTKGIVCGIYKPDPDENMVDETIRAASTADIVIIDWQLENGSSVKAKKVIANLLKNDVDTGPRLRSIAIYTGQKGLQVLARELLEYIVETNGICGFQLSPIHHATITGPNTRLTFINKKNTLNRLEEDQVADEAELPELLLSEYTQLAAGILPTTAMAAIADIRHATPHLLTVFNKSLDGAYVGHRAMIPIAEDADTFLRRLISEEIDAVIESSGSISKFAGNSSVGSWLKKLDDDGHKFKDHKGRKVDIELIQKALAHISETPKAYESEIVGLLKEKLNGSKEVNKSLFREFARLFYIDNDSSLNSLKDFSRLNQIKREIGGRSRFHEDWHPSLSLGTIIKPVIDRRKKKQAGNLEPDQLLLCVQPRCDSVRLPGDGRKFPFLILSPSDPKFQYIIKNSNKDVSYSSSSFLYNLVLLSFPPLSEGDQTIKAEKNKGSYIFIADEGKFEWVADLKDMHAQNIAGQLGTRAASVGYDEHEWLRIKS